MVNRISKDIGWHRITQHTSYWLTPLIFGTFAITTSYMLGTLCANAPNIPEIEK